MTATSPVGVHQRVLPSLVDNIALTDPSRILYSAFAHAVNRCSWFIEKNLGRGQNFPTLAYMGPQDLVYAILILACNKTGYRLLLNSPRNTLETHLSLLANIDCDTFLFPPNFRLPVVKQILNARQMRVLKIAEWQHWIQGPSEPYPYEKDFSEAKSEPFVVLHTSGSTELPKPIIQTQETIAVLDSYTSMTKESVEESVYPAMCAGRRVYLAFPLFHCAGTSMILPGAIYSGFTIVLGPFPPSAEIANGVHLYGNVQESCLTPTTLVDLAKDAEYLSNLGRLTQITFGGGPCPTAVGNAVSSKTRLMNCLGTTKCGILPFQLCDPEDWPYMKVSPVVRQEYRHVSEDLYEQVIVRNPELKAFQGIFRTFPKLQEWPLKYLYSKHPTQDNVWLYRGRTDDIVVFSNGEKLNPLEMDSIIDANPAVNAALTVSPSHGRIYRSMIAFTSPERPMLRAGKGTVASEAPTGGITNIDVKGLGNGQTSVNKTVKNILASTTDIDFHDLDLVDADLFGPGVDSLQVIMISKEINNYLAKLGKSPKMEPRTVYSNPSIATLMTVVSALAEGRPMQGTKGTRSNERSMQKLYDLYSSSLPFSARQPLPKPLKDFTVLVTGTTGSLGSYILDSLLSDSRVLRIYCLNRGPDSIRRQQRSQAAKGLQPPSSTKVTCLDTDLSKPYFGLPAETYKKLLGEVTIIVHNAWQVDFNLSIDSFASQVAAVRKLVDFSAHSTFGVNIFFISSISAVSNWGTVAGHGDNKVPEQILQNWRIPQEIRYGESRFVSERVLDIASRAAISATVCRIGQVAGPTTATGIWPKQEWLPSLIASSKHLGKLPDSLGRMDTLAIGSLFSTPKAGATVYHAVNPQQTSWAALIHTISRSLGREKAVEIVTLDAWLDSLRASASNKLEDIVQNPAVKILDPPEGPASKADFPVLLDTVDTVAASRKLKDLGPVTDAWMENWLRQWAF
ncbi:hypothetical protein F4810DRAFT_704756 [Camillea tinctor]|nr:hypothetical protein F4810DRAFT_704756 [Camillea tinctor]